MSRMFAVYFSNSYVVDNQLLAEEYSRKFLKPAVYIPYGANSRDECSPAPLGRFGLQEKDYIIFVGRFVKEKGIDFLIENFVSTDTKHKLVIVGVASDGEYERKLRSLADSRVVFAGFQYGPEYQALLAHALFYVSCSFLEGTSPSLLTAMAVNGFALVSDLPENLEVLKGTCAVFCGGNAEDFRYKLLYYLANPALIEEQRKKTRTIVASYYDWDVITDKYVDLLREVKPEQADPQQ